MYSSVQIRQIRAMDGITYILAALAVIFYFPALWRDLPGHPSFFSIIPIVLLSVATFFFPKQEDLPNVFHTVLLRLKVASIMAAGLCPFIIWWLRMPDHAYFMLFSGLAVGVFGWYLLELLDFLGISLRKLDQKRLAFETMLVRTLLLYIVLVPFGVVFSMFLAAVLKPDRWGAVRQFLSLWDFAPMGMRIILLLPSLMTLIILLKSKKHFLAQKAQQQVFSGQHIV